MDVSDSAHESWNSGKLGTSLRRSASNATARDLPGMNTKVMSDVPDAPWITDYDTYFNLYYQVEDDDDLSDEPDDSVIA